MQFKYNYVYTFTPSFIEWVENTEKELWHPICNKHSYREWLKRWTFSDRLAKTIILNTRMTQNKLIEMCEWYVRKKQSAEERREKNKECYKRYKEQREQRIQEKIWGYNLFKPWDFGCCTMKCTPSHCDKSELDFPTQEIFEEVCEKFWKVEPPYCVGYEPYT